MTSVFIGGSRRINTLNTDLRSRLDNIIHKHLRVLVGDAKGFDLLAQGYLARQEYQDVIVFCTLGVCRNNVGNWPQHAVDHGKTKRGFEFYAAKDDAMAQDADYGFFAWDGKSKGTLRNICNMASAGKVSLVYLSPERSFVTVRSVPDASQLAQHVGLDLIAPTGLLSTDQVK